MTWRSSQILKMYWTVTNAPVGTTGSGWYHISHSNDMIEGTKGIRSLLFTLNNGCGYLILHRLKLLSKPVPAKTKRLNCIREANWQLEIEADSMPVQKQHECPNNTFHKYKNKITCNVNTFLRNLEKNVLLLPGFNDKLVLFKLFEGGLGLLRQVFCKLHHLGLEFGKLLFQCGLILGLCLNAIYTLLNLICSYIKSKKTTNCCLRIFKSRIL